MKNKDFTISIVVDQSPQQVFDAINQPQNWWTGEVKGSAAALSDEFIYRYEDFHMSKQKVMEMIPGKKVVWLVTECCLNYVEDKNEWTGTKITFEIKKEGTKTRLDFTHIGLHSDIECFDSCSNSWTSLVRLSLLSLITTGKGENLVLT